MSGFETPGMFDLVARFETSGFENSTVLHLLSVFETIRACETSKWFEIPPVLDIQSILFGSRV